MAQKLNLPKKDPFSTLCYGKTKDPATTLQAYLPKDEYRNFYH